VHGRETYGEEPSGIFVIYHKNDGSARPRFDANRPKITAFPGMAVPKSTRKTVVPQAFSISLAALNLTVWKPPTIIASRNDHGIFLYPGQYDGNATSSTAKLILLR
jgi:hypothetical protein